MNFSKDRVLKGKDSNILILVLEASSGVLSTVTVSQLRDTIINRRLSVLTWTTKWI